MYLKFYQRKKTTMIIIYDDLNNKINFDNFKKLDDENEFNKYKFDTDEDIIKSFETIFK